MLLTSFMQNDSYHLFRNMILIALFGPFVEDRIGSKNSIILFIFSASAGLLLYTIHFELLRSAESVVRGSSGGTIAFAGIGISLIINNMTNIDWFIASAISVIFVTHIELIKVVTDTSFVSSAYPVMTAHVGGLISGYLFLLLLSYVTKNNILKKSDGRYNKI